MHLRTTTRRRLSGRRLSGLALLTLFFLSIVTMLVDRNGIFLLAAALIWAVAEWVLVPSMISRHNAGLSRKAAAKAARPRLVDTVA